MRLGQMTRMMNRRTVLLGLGAVLIAPEAFAQTAPSVLTGAERTAAIAAANRSLNSVQRMHGRFTQTSPGNQRATGAFYMQRPGRLRFEYDAPSTLLIVSDGSVVALRDTELRTTERTPLRSTPLHFILAAQIDLERDARIMRVSRADQWTLITVRDRTGQTEGQIVLQFYGPQTELRSWDVTDATGSRTRIALSNVTRPASFDRRLFRLDDVLTDRGRR